MTNHQKIWVNQARWRDSWVVVRKLQQGGQGKAWRVRRKHDGREGFLKEAKKKKDPRFFREAAAYDTFNARGIPRLIESNAHRHRDKEFKPYIVTDFIEGRTVRQWRESQVRVELDTGIKATRELLAILCKCHAAKLMHRDVKPDNIIFEADNPGRPVLLDFGLSFREESETDFKTETGEEIGNRFLRLPEFSADSFRKQDVRSDASFAAGILFYLLTGQHPRLLQDAEGRLPHQRTAALTILQELDGTRLRRLMSFFDNAFEPLIGNRFSSAAAMLESMERVMEPRDEAHSEESLLQDIREAMDTQAARRQDATHRRLSEALKQIHRVHVDVRKSLGIVLNQLQTGYSVVGDLGRNTLGWGKPGSEDTVLSVMCEVREAGDEIVIHLSGDPVYRTSIISPRYNGQFDEEIRNWLLVRLREAVTNPE